MINILLFLFFLTCAGIVAAWIAENPGNIIIHWHDYRIDSSFAFLLILTIVAALVIAYAYILLRKLFLAPENLSSRRQLKYYKKGLVELTHSVAALAASDIIEAEKHTHKAQKLLGQTPLTLLLSAQIARSKGDDGTTHELLIKMLDHKETEYLAARSLSDSASKKQHLPTALSLAQRAHALNPRGIAQVVSLHIRLNQWQQALIAIDKALRNGQISRTDMRRHKGIIYLQQGVQLLESGNVEAASFAGKQCLKYQPEFSPAIAFAAKAFVANNQRNKAIKLVFKAWKKSPDETLASAFTTIIANEPKEKQLSLANKLAASNHTFFESDIMLAQIALLQRDWRTARKSLNAALNKTETVRACMLMADVEKQERADYEAAAIWLSRSNTAIPEPSWFCSHCSHASMHWQPHCPNCDSFDTLQWK